MTQDLQVENKQGVLIVTINRPQARNALTQDVAYAVAAAIDELEKDNELRVGIITGAGGSFCSGMDLKGFLKGERPSVPGRGFAGVTEAPPTKPLIAAVEGYALAGGFELALACDLIVAAENAQFGLPEVKRGLVATAGGLLRLPKRLPYHIAMQHILTGDLLTAPKAHHHGLVNYLVPPGCALEEALKVAQQIMQNGPLALAASKRIVTESVDWSQDEMFAKQKVIAAPVFESKDAREGATAFAEKRPPVWSGA